jgi:hypothetical protein
MFGNSYIPLQRVLRSYVDFPEPMIDIEIVLVPLYHKLLVRQKYGWVVEYPAVLSNLGQ